MKAMEKLIIKIKIPLDGNELHFDCPICQKSFSSGKGLGGHKRVHMEMAGKTKSHHKMELQIKETGKAEQILSCPICKQSFPSDKSLHGHMRKHPDRNWRGMRPPIPQVKNSDLLVPVSDAVTLENTSSDQNEWDKLALATNVLMSGWAGGRSQYRKAPIDIAENDKESICVAYDLMALANGETWQEEDFGTKKKKLELPVSSRAENSRPVVVGGVYSFPKVKAAGSIRGKNSFFVGKGNIQKMPIIRGQKKYVCNICNRPFRSYQALGGHKSHHNYLKVGEEDKCAAIDQCLTGKALGDHRQRCCGSLPPIMNEVECPRVDKEICNQSIFFSFDLNELPGPGADGDC